MNENAYVVDTRRAYFNPSMDFLDSCLPPRVVYVFHPCYQSNDNGVQDMMLKHGYTKYVLGPDLDEYRLEKQRQQAVIENYKPNIKKEEKDQEEKTKRFGNALKTALVSANPLTLLRNWAITIFIFIVVCLILYMIIKALIKRFATRRATPGQPVPMGGGQPVPMGGGQPYGV